MNTAPTQASVDKYGRIKIITYRLFLHKSADVGTKIQKLTLSSQMRTIQK